MSATTLSPRAAKKARKLGAEYIPPSPYSLKNALANGDVWTKLSIIVFGLGNVMHKQIIKGLLLFAGEVLFILFMIFSGAHNLSMLPSLGDHEQRQVKDADGFYHYEAGDNSVVILLYGVATVVICLVFIAWWIMSIRSAYKAQCEVKAEGHALTFGQDVKAMLNQRANITLMFLPILGIAIFTVLPLIFMISMAFTNYDHNHLVLFDWDGLNSFKEVFASTGSIVNGKLFLSVLGWTLIWAFFATFLNFFLGLFLAMILNRPTTAGKSVWRAIFSMSIAVPQFVSLLVMSQMLQPQGAINRLLQSWGWIDSPLPFLVDANWARVTVIIVNLWVGIPYTIMQVTGILQNIPADLYEAARIDGANWWQTFTKITMPYIFFVLTPYLITTFTGNVNNFNVIYLLTKGEPTPVGASAGKTDLLITWLYKLTVEKNDYNLGAVIGIMTFIVLAIVSLITYRSTGSYKNEEGFR
ncbi:carbohydrate ABC transporter permease [Bifidobacterium gallicum]|uniref:Maltose/maltodextrin transport system permease protein n=1 Tax=Bifidobacterium gallicum DSM 20093 = LMG 11596 TaxID=561180 RepID=D1NX24_9BIFI|nr:sugar ABC transporter permease [Bifidobacterium gallicum]EFA22084.1 ABC transporter, permease protein [Bifidobacterium gallicum DSM 20093 = LMG 11596]KFI59348.1 sugar ABC transporter permease [Bifidobacterium gallicum DSM 20093 = LMG 11596]